MSETPTPQDVIASLRARQAEYVEGMAVAGPDSEALHAADLLEAALAERDTLRAENERLTRAWGGAKHKSQAEDRYEARKMFDLSQSHAARAERAEAELAELAEARAALRKALNFIQNSESEHGVTLPSGDAVRAALAKEKPQ